VVFEPNVASSLFGFLSACLSGHNIYLHRSFLADKLNTKIATDKLNIIDNGRLIGGVGTMPFDADGVPTRLNSIIKNGVLQTYLMGTYSARKLGMKSTGNASGPTNFIIEPTDKTQDDLIRTIDKGILITSTIGQGTDTTTGDISKGAFGLMIENGELTYPVSEITFSGNLGDILNNIEMIADKPNDGRTIQSPAIKLKEINISGS
jgi:PmbA protein